MCLSVTDLLVPATQNSHRGQGEPVGWTTLGWWSTILFITLTATEGILVKEEDKSIASIHVRRWEPHPESPPTEALPTVSDKKCGRKGLGRRTKGTYDFFGFHQLGQHCPHCSLHSCIQSVPIPYHLMKMVSCIGIECIPVLQSLDLNTATWGLICSRTLCLSWAKRTSWSGMFTPDV